MGLDETRIPAPNSRNSTPDTRHSPSQFRIRGCHSLARCFPADFFSLCWARHGSKHHIALSFQQGFGLSSAAFTRRYLRYRNFFLFLPVIRCFNSGRSLSLAGVYRMSYWAISGSKTACVSPKLTAAYHRLRRLLSLAIHQIPWELAIFTSGPMTASTNSQAWCERALGASPGEFLRGLQSSNRVRRT